jgi:hypothetical protein
MLSVQRAPEGTKSFVATLFGMTANEVEGFLQGGQQYLAATDSINRKASDLLQTRYGSPRPAAALRNSPRSSMPPANPIRIRPGFNSVLQMVQEDGLFAQVESEHQQALNQHLAVLGATLNPDSLSRIQSHVEQQVRPHIVIVNGGVHGVARPKPE